MDASLIADAGLHGWKKNVGNRLSGPISNHTPLSREEARAVFGAVFFLLSLRYVVKSVAALAKR